MARLPMITEPANEAERAALAALPRYDGPAWRAESGFWHESDTSAAEVIRFERYELGNAEVDVNPAIEAMLDRVRAVAVVWACPSRELASRYDGELFEVSLPAEVRVLVAEDGDGGMLLWLRPDAGAR